MVAALILTAWAVPGIIAHIHIFIRRFDLTLVDLVLVTLVGALLGPFWLLPFIADWIATRAETSRVLIRRRA